MPTQETQGTYSEAEWGERVKEKERQTRALEHQPALIQMDLRARGQGWGLSAHRCGFDRPGKEIRTLGACRGKVNVTRDLTPIKNEFFSVLH